MQADREGGEGAEHKDVQRLAIGLTVAPVQPFSTGKQHEAKAETIGRVQPVAAEIAIFDEARRREPDREQGGNASPELGEIRIFCALAFQEGKGAQHEDSPKAERHGNFRSVACAHGRKRHAGIIHETNKIDATPRHERHRRLRAERGDDRRPDGIVTGSAECCKSCNKR